MSEDPITRHFFTGFIRLHILYHATKEAIYGAEIAEELAEHGYQLSQGTLYPILHGLEKLGLLRSRVQLIAGRRRKYYRATAAGLRVLTEARAKLTDLVAEVLDDQDQQFQKIRHRRGHHKGQR